MFKTIMDKRWANVKRCENWIDGSDSIGKIANIEYCTGKHRICENRPAPRNKVQINTCLRSPIHCQKYDKMGTNTASPPFPHRLFQTSTPLLWAAPINASISQSSGLIRHCHHGDRPHPSKPATDLNPTTLHITQTTPLFRTAPTPHSPTFLKPFSTRVHIISGGHPRDVPAQHNTDLNVLLQYNIQLRCKYYNTTQISTCF